MGGVGKGRGDRSWHKVFANMGYSILRTKLDKILLRRLLRAAQKVFVPCCWLLFRKQGRGTRFARDIGLFRNSLYRHVPKEDYFCPSMLSFSMLITQVTLTATPTASGPGLASRGFGPKTKEIAEAGERHERDPQEHAQAERSRNKRNKTKKISIIFRLRAHLIGIHTSGLGAMYTALAAGLVVKRRMRASSAQAVFPLPVGAQTSTFASPSWSSWNTCERSERQKEMETVDERSGDKAET